MRDNTVNSKKMLLKYFIALLIYILPLLAGAQVTTYPVQVYTQLTPPYTPYVPAYYSGTQDKLKVTIINSDMQQPSLQVYLRMQITSSMFSMINPPEVYTPPLELQSGVPLVLSMNDLEPYFKRENLRISGGQSQFYRTQMLPDNFYRFHFEVFEVNTNRLLSNKKIGFAQAMITAGDPPILNLPKKGDVIKESNIPNIMFTWTPRHMSSVAAAYGTEYEITLVEIQDKKIDPENAFQYSKVLYTETSRSTSFMHTTAQPILIPGMRYGWRVKAIAREGIEEANVFKNNGFSEIFWFDYKGDCPVVVSSGVVTQRTEANISWQNTQAIDYAVEYRKKGSSRWTNAVVSDNSSKLYSLKPGETYEYRIGSRCYANDLFDYSEIKAFTMPLELERSPNCGILPDVNLSNQTPTRELQIGMPILVGDFPVFITKASGSGKFSGEGYVGIPYLEGTQVAVTFKDIVVNTDNRLVSGFFETKYDINNNNLLVDLDQTLTGGKDVGDIRTGEEKAAFIVDYNINPNIKAKPVKKDDIVDDIADGSDYTFTKGENETYEFVIVDEEGKEHKVESSTMPVTIEDNTGTTYEVNEKGEITQISAQSDIKLDDQTKDKINKDIASIDFRESHNSKYALDQYKEIYGKVTEYNDQYRIGDSNDYASAKFILPGTTDEIIAFIKAEGKKSSLIPGKVRFVTDKGKEYQAKYNESEQTWTITITGSNPGDGQQLYAVQEIGGGKYATLGKLNIFTYEPLQRSVTLVPVGGEMNKLDKQSVEDGLNKIYGKIGIEWTVNVLNETFNYTPKNGSTFNVTGSGLFSTLTDDMKGITEAFKASGHYQEDGLYLFILPFEASDKGEVNDTGGDMPLGHQFGYLFPGADSRTIAHEVGHGAFNIDHPFSRPGRNSFAKGTLTDNLMDYTQGTEFAKMQWDQTRAPGMVIGLFQKDKDAMYPSYSNGGVGITPSNMVIVGMPEEYKNFKEVSIHNTFKSSKDYAIQGWDLYNNEGTIIHSFRWSANKNKYVKYDLSTKTYNENVVFNVKLAEEGHANLFMIKEGDKCYLYYRHIDWKKGNTLSNIDPDEKNLMDGWRYEFLHNPDPSCSADFREKVKESYQCKQTTSQLDETVLYLKGYISTISNMDKSTVADLINAVCFEALIRLSYQEKVIFFDKLIEGTIEDNAEGAVLKTMSALYSNDYKQFISHLSLNNYEKLKHLLKEMDDAYVLFWTGNNYTNFMGALIYMYNKSPEIYEEKLEKEDIVKLLEKSISVYSSPFKSEIKYQNVLIPLGKSKIGGQYNEKTGKITINREEYLIPKVVVGTPYPPMWVPVSTLDDVEPFDPIVIMGENELPLVQTALDASELPAGSVYVIPAIFFKYKEDLELTDQSITNGTLILDAVTIYASGGTAIATKVPKLRRLWAVGEVVGAVGNIAVNTGAITTDDPALYQAVNTFNLAMGIIGIKNLGTGAVSAGKGFVNAVKNLPKATLDLINKNQSLRKVFRDSYIAWRTSLAQIKNLDNLTPEELAALNHQDEVYRMLGVADNATDGSLIHWRDAIKAGEGGGSVGDKSHLFNNFNNNANVPSKYLRDENRFNNLAKDADHNFEITPTSRKEALTGLEAEAQGIINNIERGPAGIEFYDVNRTPWDVKTPFGGSYFKVSGKGSIGEAIVKELTESKIINKITHPAGKYIDPISGIARDKHILLDCTYINETELIQLRNWLKNSSGLTNSQLSRIKEIVVPL